MPIEIGKRKKLFKHLDDLICFGKHKGSRIGTICEEDPGYIAWLDENDVAGLHNDADPDLSDAWDDAIAHSDEMHDGFLID